MYYAIIIRPRDPLLIQERTDLTVSSLICSWESLIITDNLSFSCRPLRKMMSENEIPMNTDHRY